MLFFVCVCERESRQLEDVITTLPLSVLQRSAGSQRTELGEVSGYSSSLSHSLWKCGGIRDCCRPRSRYTRTHTHTKLRALLTIRKQFKVKCVPRFGVHFGTGWIMLMMKM